jgi:hypothetical protein
MGSKFIIGGDFNAKNTAWGSRLTSTKGKELLNAIKETGCDVMSTGKPTYWPTDPNKIPDLIDFFIIKNLSFHYLKIEEKFELNSDHSPILLTLSEHIIQKESAVKLTNKYTNWKKFKICLEDKIQLAVHLRNKDQLDAEVEKFINDIQSSAWENTPCIKRKLKGNNYPAEIVDLLKDKRKARKKWHQTRNPSDKTKLNNLTQQLRREISEIKNETFNRYLRELNNDKSSDYSLWKATNKFKRPVTQVSAIRLENNLWMRSNTQKVEAFAEHLRKTFSLENEQIEDNIDEVIIQQNQQIRHTTTKEVIKEIKYNISTKKAPSYDLINGEVIKQLPRKAIVKLTNIINAAFRLKYVPKLWKVAEVIMIPKPGKPPHLITSYRPISLLPILSKLFEKLLLKRLNQIIEEQNLIPDHQFGFRTQHSTIDQVHRITSVIEKSLEDKNVCSTVFLDVAQAFDKVWHKGLIHKLKSMLPKEYSEILESYLSDRYFRVKQENEYSEIKEIKAGVPQGSVLGPVLYLLYTSDIPNLGNNTIATYADDTAIMAIGSDNDESTIRLQSAINSIFAWTKKWKLKLNETKSVHVDFTNKNINYKPVYINNQVIPHANTAKYLGMTLDAKLRWKAHVKKKREELELKYRKMYWRNSQVSTQNKLLLYKQILKPVWTYGIQLWGCTKKSNIEIIQRFENKVLRNIVNAPWYVRNSDLHRDLKIADVIDEIKYFSRSHEQRLHLHVNDEAIQLLDVTGITRRLKRTKPHDLV